MTDNQVATAAVAEEKVEILNKDEHVAWVDLVDGEWTYSPASLPINDYRFTAKYGGETSAGWQLTVKDPPNLDDFSDITLGPLRQFERTYFSVTSTTSGPIASWQAPMEGTISKRLELYANRGPDANYSLIVTFTFKQEYQQVSFLFVSSDLIEYGQKKAEAFNASGRMMDVVDLLNAPDGRKELNSDAVNSPIRTLKFTLSPEVGRPNALRYFLDDIMMVP